jgi:hypothetical protein
MASSLLFCLSIFSAFGVSLAVADDARTSVSRHTISGGRMNPSKMAETDEAYGVLETSGDKSASGTRGSFSKPGAGSSASQSSDFNFWIYDVDVQLFNDDDLDGYFHGIDVLFDADTNFGVADVYAVLYLSFEGGPWNEYAVTEDFSIFAASGSDEYVLVTELMSGYPTGSYDLLIELFDAYDGTFLADFGPEDSSGVSFLSLEDFNRDAPLGEVQVTVNHGSGGGGSLDIWMLGVLILLLVFSAARKIWNRRNDELVRIDSPAPIWRDGRTNIC